MKAAIRALIDAKLSAPTRRRGRGRPKKTRTLMMRRSRFSSYNDEQGYTIYFIRCGGFVKIGYTRGEPERRMSSMATGSPHELEMLAKMPGGREIEKRLHRMFRQQHHRGEWFRLEDELYEFLKSAKETGKFFVERGPVPKRQKTHEELSPLTELLQLDKKEKRYDA